MSKLVDLGMEAGWSPIDQVQGVLYFGNEMIFVVIEAERLNRVEWRSWIVKAMTVDRTWAASIGP